MVNEDDFEDDIIKMRSNWIQNYERKLVESAVESAVESTKQQQKLEFAQKMENENYSREEILKITGIDISKI